MIAGVIRFRTQGRVCRIARRLLEGALVVFRRRFVAQDDNDLPFEVDSGIVVVSVIFGFNALAAENNFPFDFPGFRKSERVPTFVQTKSGSIIESKSLGL